MTGNETPFGASIAQIIRTRYSCRTYSRQPIDAGTQHKLAEFISSSSTAPFRSATRFELIAATEQDRKSLSGLGTYGFIKDPTAFLVGAVRTSDRDMEDYGYLLERIVLFATSIGLGTCWLGGSFKKSNFARRIDLEEGESLPAVASVGYIAEKPRRVDGLIRRGASSDARKSWQQVFFDGPVDRPLSPESAGAYAGPLEMVRLAPSASNKQPWRLVRQDGAWHFFLQRTPGYGRGRFMRFPNMADMQRIDMGIAMSHFELSARELGLDGTWETTGPGVNLAEGSLEYVVTWASKT